MGSLILHHINDPVNHNKHLHFFINSGGNAGLAAVCAARSLSYPCTVVLPLSASRLMIEKLCAAGATQVIQYGETIAAAGEYMREVLMNDGDEDNNNHDNIGNSTTTAAAVVKKIALHPFDHEAIWEGNSTIVDELSRQLPPEDDDDEDEDDEGGDAEEDYKKDESRNKLPLDAMICSVGGGGLINGLIQGIQRYQPQDQRSGSGSGNKPDKENKDIHILAVETDGTQSMNLAISSRSLVTLPKITSMAVSLACVRVSQKTFEYCVSSPPAGIKIHSAVLSDADAARGCLRLADDERILVELACGVCIEAAIGDAVTAAAERSKNSKRLRTLDGIDEKIKTKKLRNESDSLQSCASDSGIASSVSSSSSSGSVSRNTGGDELQAEKLSSSYLKKMIPNLTPRSRVVIIVCGGSNVTTGMASEWREKLANGWV